MLLALLLAAAFAPRAEAVDNTATNSGFWTNAAIWSAGTTPQSDHDVVIPAGITVTNTGLATNFINSLTITGTLTHAAHTTTDGNTAKHKLVMDVVTDLTIASGGAIDVNGRGYAGATSSRGNGYGPGAGKYVPAGYSYMGGGGAGHGGEGGNSSGGAGSAGAVYGSLESPSDLGSGGAEGHAGAGGNGGGAIKLTVGSTLTVNGALSANGNDGSSRGGGGSGGSIWISCVTLAGTNAVTAHGGSRTSAEGGGGAGGRIAIGYTTRTHTGAISAHGKVGYGSAAAGTIYLKAAGDAYGSVIVDNNNLAATATTLMTNMTPQLASLTVTNLGKCNLGSNTAVNLASGTLSVSTNSWLQFSSGGTLLVPADTYALKTGNFWFMDTSPRSYLATTNLVVTNNATLVIDGAYTHTGNVLVAQGVLTHTANSTGEVYKLNLRVTGELNIAPNGAVNAAGKGYAGGANQANGYGPGGGRVDFSTDYRGGGGGGHGGEGGNGVTTGLTPIGGKGTTYGSVTNPAAIGSGGGGGRDGTGGAGGGAILLDVAGTLRADGPIDVNGTNGTLRSGGGAGGGIWISCGTLAGTNAIMANGGTQGSGGYGGGGGGGRIRLAYGSRTHTGPVTALGANGYQAGAGGTIFERLIDRPNGTLTVENGNQSTPSTTLISSNVTDTTVSNVVIRQGGHLRLATNQTLTVQGDWTNGASFSAHTGGTIVFAGAATSRLDGSTAFFGLSCTTPGKPLVFQAGTTTTVSSLTLTGASGNPISLGSTAPGNQWFLKMTSGGAQAVSFVTVRDSNALPGDPITPTDSTNGGNNDNWQFGGAVITWTGAAGPSWGTPGSWDLNRLPTALDPEIIIPNVATNPRLDSARQVFGTLTIQTGGRLELNNYNLIVSSNATIAGTLAATNAETVTFLRHADFSGGELVRAASTVVMGGATAQTLTGGGAVFNNVTVTNNSAAVTFAGGLTSTVFVCQTPGAALTFEKDAVFACANLTLTAPTNNRIVLRSSQNGQQWKLNVSGWSAVRGVDAQDSDASGGLKIWAKQSLGASANNTNWDFSTWRVWNGAVNGSFTNPANWASGSAPGSGDAVLIDGGYANAPVISSTTTVRRLTLGGSAASTLTVNTNLTVTEDVTIYSGGTLTHSANAATPAFWLDLSVGGNLFVYAGGAINMDGKGYAGGGITTDGSGPGRGTQTFSTDYRGGGGGGHGGEGGDATTAPASGTIGGKGTTYGAVTAPLTLGSGGAGGRAGTGGAGGGAMKLVVTSNLVVNGTLSANGSDGSDRAGGGAGGGIWISCATLAGTNAIAANGGNQGSYSGGGGGGRIVLVYGAKTFSGPVIARGGSGYNQYGSAGTIYEQTVAQGTGAGTVLIDNNNLSTAVRTQIPPATNAVPDELKYASILVTNRGALAVTTNATVQALTVASATEPLDLGAADTVLTVRSLSVNGLAYTKGGLYTTNNWNGYALPGANVTGAGAIRIVNSGTAIMMR